MAWLWSSWKEFVDRINPSCVTSQGSLGLTLYGSWFETEERLFQAVQEIRQALEGLYELGFTGKDDNQPPAGDEIEQKAHKLVIEIVQAGEELLLCHKRLAVSDAAYGFRHSHDILEHWERYSGTRRIPREVDQLVKDVLELLAGFQEMIEYDSRLLVNTLDLPKELEAEFRLARNLFSVGFDDVALLIAGRAFEGVLRSIAVQRRIVIVTKGSPTLGKEADFNDLIEALYRIRWRGDGSRLIGADTRALLHYLRTMRNEGAHGGSQLRKPLVSPRETAIVVAETANRLWKEIAQTRARIDTAKVDKTW
jgi:hypothetical protein